jgi:hypothetical protein
MDDTTIRPALTPEEWAHEVPDSLHSPDTAIQFAVGHVVLSEEWRHRRERALPAMIAILNHALPDGHPQKFTQEDVRALRKMADDEEWAESRGDAGRTGMDPYDARSLAARIAALLPPEPRRTGPEKVNRR